MSNSKRSGKFYRKNEQEVMKSLGFEPTYNSGSSWIEKEDGQNEYGICQLKSTDAKSIRIDLKDIEKLEYNALVSHKLPVFVIQFLETNEVFLVIRPAYIGDTLQVINGDRPRESHSDFLNLLVESPGVHNDIIDSPKGISNRKIIKSNFHSRKNFMRENDNKYQKKSKSAR